jgi:hypothetical protein
MGLSDLFGGGGAVEQLFIWGVVNQVVSQVMGPTMNLITQKVNADNPTVPLSPADLAQLVVRNYIDNDEGQATSRLSGITGTDFNHLVALAGEAPAPGDLATALRRGIIAESGSGAGSTAFDQGIREGHLGDKWISVIKDLAVQWPSPTDALDALLEGQISQADAEDLYKKFGGDPQFFTMLFNTRGSAPTPDEAAVMANRGIIPWTGSGAGVVSFEQAFLEGPWRNKWLTPYRDAAQYYPPPRTITAMLKNGSLSVDQAMTLLQQQGLTQELAAAYVHDAQLSQNSADRDLTVSQVLDMYEAALISPDDATGLLVALNYSTDNAKLLLAYKDLQRAIATTNTAVSRIATLYIGHKISRSTAVSSLNTLNVPAAQVQEIIQLWDLQASVNVKTLTESQIVDAWFYQSITQDQAMNELEGIGYTPFDAWVLLSNKNKGPLGAPPVAGPAPITGTVIPGTTQ